MAENKRKQQKQKAAEARRQRELERLKKVTEKQIAALPPEPPPQVEEPPLAETMLPGLDEPLLFHESEDELWEDFEKADLEGSILIFQQVLESGNMDDEYAFEMLEAIRKGLLELGAPGRARYAGLVDQLKNQSPEVYRQDSKYYHQNMITDAIDDGRWEALPELLVPFAECTDLDVYSQVIEQLFYHGQGRLLIPAMSQVWPKISDADDLFDWAKEEFGGNLMQLILWNYLEESKNPHPGDRSLLDATAPYGLWQEGWLERFIPRFITRTPSLWKITDFGPAVDAEQWEINLHNLLAEFVADRHWAGIPYSRADLGWPVIAKAIMWQFIAPTIKRQKKDKRGKTSNVGSYSNSSLVPTYQSMDITLGELFPFLGGQPYKAAAAVELLPAYLHFLARLGLIHPTEMDQALIALKPLSLQIYQILKNFGVNAGMPEAMMASWSPEILAGLQNDPALVGMRAAHWIVPAPQVKTMHSPTALQTYTFKVTYQEDDEIWRMIELTEKQTLDDLHQAIQDAVDFDDDHLYSFFMSGKAWDASTAYISPRDRDGVHATRIHIGDLNLRMKQRFLYLFDYGDEHQFDVQLIGSNPDAPKRLYPRLVESHGDSPSQYKWDDEGEDWDEDEEDDGKGL